MSNLRFGPELWGGVECTVNRVDDTFFNQLERSGHHGRIAEDLQRFSALGLKALRVGLNWEQYETTGSWQPWDELLSCMEHYKLRPIAGLLHHGSGPTSTSLLDPEFPEKLATYALKVAERYPHILDYTPVNEPQTTGRFSCLYGHWYPHHHSMASYVRSMYNQIKGIVLAMRAIRTVQPEARLIHTEDAGATYATPALEGIRQDRERRRWMGADLLCGLVTRDHGLFDFLVENGLTEDEILWFTDNACPPSVLGLNYYVTSDRFLDERTDLYAQPPGGDTGDEALVDVEAVRVRPEGITGAGAVLREAWDRYRLPVAITEAHLGCDAVEQGRWLYEVWQDAQAAAADGVDVRSVTIWALLGSFNWCYLCTVPGDLYEPGLFNVSSGTPEATPLADLAYRLAHGLPVEGPVTEAGWWRNPNRLLYPAPPTAEAAHRYR